MNRAERLCAHMTRVLCLAYPAKTSGPFIPDAQQGAHAMTVLLTKQGNGDGEASAHAARVSPGPDAGSGRKLDLGEEDVALLLHRRAWDALQRIWHVYGCGVGQGELRHLCY